MKNVEQKHLKTPKDQMHSQQGQKIKNIDIIIQIFINTLSMTLTQYPF